MCFVFLLGPAPFFVASLFCFVAKRKSGWGICGSFLVAVVVLFWFSLFFVMICQSFWTHTCPCTFLLFTAYAIVRTEPSANRPNRRKKKGVEGEHPHTGQEAFVAMNRMTEGPIQAQMNGESVDCTNVCFLSFFVGSCTE